MDDFEVAAVIHHRLLVPILRSRLKGVHLVHGDAPDDLSLAPLVDWLKSGFKSDRAAVPLTSERIRSTLAQAARELVDEIVEPNGARAHAYGLLRLVRALLCEPPTVTAVLAHTCALEDYDVESFLGTQSVGGDAELVATVVLERLHDLLAEPELARDTLPSSPLTSFADLHFLGGLRHAFARLYSSDIPKAAQAAYIPGVLRSLQLGFSSNRPSRTVIVAPTNGGKNGIIVAAAMAAIAWDKGPVLVLQPYRAQIAESARTWTEAVAGFPVHRPEAGVIKSMRIAGSSALLSELDGAIVRGRIDISAVIPEKLAVLARHRRLSDFCKLLIADEAGLLFDHDRGGKLEILLTLAKLSGISIVATGAGIGEEGALRISRWLADLPAAEDPRLSGVLLFDRSLKRDPPIELRVLRRDGAVRVWREGLGPLESNKIEVPALPEDEVDAICDLVTRELVRAPERQILVFVANREKVVRLADELARSLRAQPAIGETLTGIAMDRDETPLGELWQGAALPFQVDAPTILAQRVGVHTRDVPDHNLQRLEAGFRAGRLRVLFATTTVEAGINLPVDTVIQVGLQDHEGLRLGQRALEQRLGRSGRTIGGVSREGLGIVYLHDLQHGVDRVIPERLLRPEVITESQLTEAHRALLLLTHLRNQRRDTTTGLNSVMRDSYWAFGRPSHEISQATTAALAELRRCHLVEERVEDSEAPHFEVTRLGHATASGLLLPSDAQAVAEIVNRAISEPAGPQWLPEVLLAACSVPSIVHGNRRPREADVVTPGAMTRAAVVASWVQQRPGSAPGFSFPRLRKVFTGGTHVTLLLDRAARGVARSDELTALLRSYVSWLWVRGDQIEIAPYVRNINAHVARQDLGYYLAHVLRTAGWYAQQIGEHLIGLRLLQLALQADHGVPSEAMSFYEVCSEHVSRTEIVAVGDANYERLLDNLSAEIALDLQVKLQKRRDDRHQRQKEVALDTGIVRSEDEFGYFDRMESASDLLALLDRVCDREGLRLARVGEDSVAAGRFLLDFEHSDDPKLDRHQGDLVVSGRFLSQGARATSRQLVRSLLGAEEFLALLNGLQGKTASQQEIVLGSLAEAGMLCTVEIIEAVAGEVAALPMTLTVEESIEKCRDRIRRVAVAGSRQSAGLRAELEVDSKASSQLALLSDAADLLVSLLQERVAERVRAMPSEGSAPTIQEELSRCRAQARRAQRLRVALDGRDSEISFARLATELDALAAEGLPPRVWEPVRPSLEAL